MIPRYFHNRSECKVRGELSWQRGPNPDNHFEVRLVLEFYLGALGRQLRWKLSKADHNDGRIGLSIWLFRSRLLQSTAVIL